MQDMPNSVLEYRVTSLEAVVGEVRTAIKSIDVSLQALTRLESRHAETRDDLARAFQTIQNHEDRIRTVETEMPTVKLTRNWVVAGVMGVIGLGAVALFNVIYDNQAYRLASQKNEHGAVAAPSSP